ncbi:hypothetical protein QFZ79_001868 [Arthrobacter sp. V4I6]|uniref:hypothetical protein n=1 Tax=unclassified Arthrobacter TaxID=235627 RepID=UPI00278759FE|nr:MULTISPECIES: hypothetical protein [unclassified Arthrobacter]MDQ0819578.1 hypothetical protein [Arthrobacter sp. V1I7]MDQ0853757.1 hypothetical protein [Arthrobacter sp. V4I6]
MTLYQPEPVEISTRMRPGEWTEESLSELVATYRQDLLGMGAAPGEIDIVTDRDEGGGVSVVATWTKADVAGEEVPGDAPG